MRIILEAIDVVVGAMPPLGISVSRGDLLVLGHQEGVDVMPLLRVLAGVEPPRDGVVRIPEGTRIALSSPHDPEPLAADPDLVVVTESDDTSGDPWAFFARAKSLGVAVLAASFRFPPRQVGARVVLDLWEHAALRSELARLRARAHHRTTDLLDLLDGPSSAGVVTAAKELLAVRERSRLVLEELLRRAQTSEAQRVARALAQEVASESLDDRMLNGIVSRNGR